LILEGAFSFYGGKEGGKRGESRVTPRVTRRGAAGLRVSQGAPHSPAARTNYGLHGASYTPYHEGQRRIQTTRCANVLVYLGLPAQTPVQLFEQVTIYRIGVCVYHPNYKCRPPPHGGEQGRKGKGCPNPHAVSLVPFPIPHGGAAVSIGGVKTITVQRLSVHGCDPTVLRSEGLCEALERSHCGLYPPTPQPSYSDA
jgi:hypothetical protein